MLEAVIDDWEHAMTGDQAAPAGRRGDTGPLRRPPLGSLPGRRLPVLGAVVALLAGIALGAVWWIQRPEADTRPVEVVRNFAAALEARDVSAMLALLEPSDLTRQLSPELRIYVEYLRKIDFQDDTYELLANDGVHAQVRWTATMRYTIDIGREITGEHPVDSIVRLTKLEGSWYLSSVELPTAAEEP
jgi:hypothetical protein